MASKRKKQYSPFEQIQLMDLYAESKMRMEEFCEQHDVSKWTLMQWMRNRKNKKGLFTGGFTELPPELKPKELLLFQGAERGLTKKDQKKIDEEERWLKYSLPERKYLQDPDYDNTYFNAMIFLKHDGLDKDRKMLFPDIPDSIILRRAGWELRIPFDFEEELLRDIVSAFDAYSVRLWDHLDDEVLWDE